MKKKSINKKRNFDSDGKEGERLLAKQSKNQNLKTALIEIQIMKSKNIATQLKKIELNHIANLKQK